MKHTILSISMVLSAVNTYSMDTKTTEPITGSPLESVFNKKNNDDRNNIEEALQFMRKVSVASMRPYICTPDVPLKIGRRYLPLPGYDESSSDNNN